MQTQLIMKNFKLTISILVISFLFSIGKAQYGYGAYGGGNTLVRIESGDVASLKGVKRVNIKYDYSKMGVGAFRNEADYLKKKEEDYKKEPEKFEKFKAGWIDSRKNRYEPKFSEMFNKMGAKIGLSGGNYATDAEITLIVETVFTEPGYHIGISKQPASVDFICRFEDKDGKELLKYFIKNSIGSSAMGFDYDAGSRLVESYAKGCKVLMKDLIKQLKKVK